ncbi:MAG: metallophosphoesterase [ANME-2 cluster archaeon]|nr:metallophosphoesterase [ANME-2 cluster archaeon]MDF1557665.1 metallophosphoesterase [ANME-2 cluster archaeon]
MKMTIVSDTHLKPGQPVEMLPAPLLDMLASSDMIVHAGDFVSMQCYNELQDINRLVGVAGNMDPPELRQILPQHTIFEVEGVRIGVTHQGQLSVTDLTGLGYFARELEVDLLIFGHIHRPKLHRSGDITLLCPGSPTSPRQSEPSAAEVRVEGGEVSMVIVNFEGKVCDSIRFARSLGKD